MPDDNAIELRVLMDISDLQKKVAVSETAIEKIATVTNAAESKIAGFDAVLAGGAVSATALGTAAQGSEASLGKFGSVLASGAASGQTAATAFQGVSTSTIGIVQNVNATSTALTAERAASDRAAAGAGQLSANTQSVTAAMAGATNTSRVMSTSVGVDAEAIAKLGVASKLAGGDLLLFTEGLKGFSKAGLSSTEALTQLANSAATLGKPVALAAKSLLDEATATNTASTAAGGMIAQVKTLTDVLAGLATAAKESAASAKFVTMFSEELQVSSGVAQQFVAVLREAGINLGTFGTVLETNAKLGIPMGESLLAIAEAASATNPALLASTQAILAESAAAKAGGVAIVDLRTAFASLQETASAALASSKFVSLFSSELKISSGAAAQFRSELIGAGVDLKIFDATLRSNSAAGMSFNESLRAISEAAASASPAVAVLIESLLSESEAAVKASAASEKGGLSFAEMGHKAVEAAAEIKAGMHESAVSVAEFAEKAKLGAMGVTSAFSLMGAVMGGSIVVSVFGEMLNHIKETELRLLHLSSVTGVESLEIAKLTNAMDQMGVPSAQVENVIRKMSLAMVRAQKDTSAQAIAFRELGVDTDNWGQKLPSQIEVLKQISEHMHTSGNETRDMGNLMRTARGASTEFMAALKQGPEVLEEYIQKTLDLSKAQSAAMTSAEQLEHAEKSLSATWRELITTVFPKIVTGLQYLRERTELFKFALQTTASVAAFFGSAIIISVIEPMRAMKAAATGNFTEAAAIMKAEAPKIVDAWHEMGRQINVDAAASKKSLEDIWKVEAPGKKGEETGPSTEGMKADTSALKALVALRRAVLLEGLKDSTLAVAAMKAQFALLDTDKSTKSETAELEGVRVQRVALEEQKRLNSEAVAEMENQLQRELKFKLESDELTAARVKLRDMAAVSKGPASDSAELTSALAAQRAVILSLEASSEARVKFQNKELTDQIAHGKAMIKELDREIKDQLGAKQAEEGAVIAHSTAMANAEMAMIEHRFKLHEIGDSKRIQQLQKVLAEEERIQLEAAAREVVNAMIASEEGSGTETQLAAKLAKQAALKDAARAREMKEEFKAAEAEAAIYEKMTGAITTAFDKSVTGMIQGTLTFQNAFRNMGNSILMEWINLLLKQEMVHVQSLLIKAAREMGFTNLLKSMHLIAATSETAGIAASTAATVASGATKGAVYLGEMDTRIATSAGATGVTIANDVAAEETSVVTSESAGAVTRMQAARTAAANTWASVSAIPVIGPLLAPPAAAGAFAAVLAFERGGIIPQDQMVFGHKNEMVLPRSLSETVMAQAAGGSPGGGESGGKSAALNLHYYAPQNVTRQQLSEHADYLHSLIQKKVRGSNMRLA